MSVSKNLIHFSDMKSFRDFKSKKTSIQILISQYVYVRNFYCFVFCNQLHLLFIHLLFSLCFNFTLINLSIYSYIYLVDFHFILKKLTQFSRKDK